jgi:hypothetical protein
LLKAISASFPCDENFKSNFSFFFQGLITSHDQFKGTLGDANNEFNVITALMDEVGRICHEYHVEGSMENPYTSLTTQVCTTLMGRMLISKYESVVAGNNVNDIDSSNVQIVLEVTCHTVLETAMCILIDVTYEPQ